MSFSSNTLVGTIKIEIMSNQQLTEELHKSVMTKFEKHLVYSYF